MKQNKTVKKSKTSLPQKENSPALRLAVPKKGRLREPTLNLVRKAGYYFTLQKDELYAKCHNAHLELVFLRTEDIPVLVEKGVVDLGITGKDNVIEKQSRISEILNLNYGHCQLCLAGLNDKPYPGLKKLSSSTQKIRIATSFPFLTRRFLHRHNIKAEIITLSGSIEIMIALQVADYVIDLVQSGNTLQSNNLKALEVIGEYYTALYAKTKLKTHPVVTQLQKRLEGILIADCYSILEFNISKPLLTQAEKIAPGFDAPTISHLDDPHKVAVKVLIEKKQVNRIIEELSDLGATGIFETEIKNCRP